MYGEFPPYERDILAKKAGTELLAEAAEDDPGICEEFR